MKIENVENIEVWISKMKPDLFYDAPRHKLRISDQGEAIGDLWLPFTHTFDPETNRIGKAEKNWIILMVRAGTAALGYFQEGSNQEHKVIRAYMVRKKQGKSQIKYLKTKGKSRAGSRVRLGASEKFFEEINERISDYLNKYPVDFIAYSCAKTLWPYLFSAEGQLHKEDPRLYKIPVHIQEPGYEKLLEINTLLQSAILKTENPNTDYFSKLLDREEPDIEDEDNW
jgi:hypothetical protein